MALTLIDYKILQYVNQSTKVEQSAIVNRFSSEIDSIEYRLELLAEQEYRTVSNSFRIPIENTSYIQKEYVLVKDDNGLSYDKPTGFFYITDKGKTALQEYELDKQSELRRKYEERFWRAFPVVISLIALMKSFQNEFISLWQLVAQLLK
ncbi:hypothetical protein [Desulfosporosinus youngiae]|uniref:Uncharacterized protein n=1 Tax=Desulfosporosinus youngiae DSM 17734 TaxID=768710 RepID=H5Y273_9FIRM|nr:hypothetical protein [Desulfosporosinus youngiae]EHQ88271.1 hypothetical protein DesyoDRAFT_1101 [Desulfosporosinus youngiae DSM 17734]